MLVFCVWKRRESTCCDMKTGILEVIADDRPNYDVTWTINTAAIMKITHRPHHPLRPPKYISCCVKKLKRTSCTMKTGTSRYRYSRIDRLNYDVTWTRMPVWLYWWTSLSTAERIVSCVKCGSPNGGAGAVMWRWVVVLGLPVFLRCLHTSFDI